MKSSTRSIRPLAIVLAFLLLMSISSFAWAAPRAGLTTSDVRSNTGKLISKVARAGDQAGGMTNWKGAGTGDPLLVRTSAGDPSEYIVPVTDPAGRTISTVGIDANDGGWHWYCNYTASKFPLVSASEASSRVKGWMKRRGVSSTTLAAPEARVEGDKSVYWYFKPQGSQKSPVYQPAFTDKDPTGTVQVKPEQIGKGAAIAPSTPAGAAGLPAPTYTAPRAAAPAPSAGGYPPSYDIANVPYHTQETSWWCGPAALQMAFGYSGPDIPQSQIAGVANQNQSVGVYNDDLARAAQFSSHSTSVQNSGLHGYTGRALGYGMAYSVWDPGSGLFDRRYSDLKSLVSQNFPVVVLTYYSPPPSSGHFRVVKGYNDSLNVFIVHDPWYSGPGPMGPDVNFNQQQFVDTLWEYTYWGMITIPWNVAVSKPYSVSAGQTFTVTADVTYPGPFPMNDQYPAQNPTATIQAGSGYQVLSGPVSQPINGLGASGTGGSTAWTLKALASKSTDDISVAAQGLVSGNSQAYGNYYDAIGGVGTGPPKPPQTSRAWGHDSIGVFSPSTSWYLAEGCTRGGFETWVLVQNPSATQTAHINLTYMTSHGPVAGPTADLAPSTRTTFNVANSAPEEWSVSTKVSSDIGVVAERAVYANNRKIGTDSIGAPAPEQNWYLAEGCTGAGFETWVLVQNPSETQSAKVTLKYMTPSGLKKGPTATIPASSRMTFNVADSAPGQWSVSTQVTSDKPVIAERSMYGNNRAWGTDSIGAPGAADTWYLAEGCTNAGFETWVLVQNPSATPATVNLSYMTPSGQVPGQSATIPASSRQTFFVADKVPDQWSVSTRVTSNVPVIAERSMYGNNRTWGHDSIGVTVPSTSWYLAEGCTNTGFESWVLVQNPNDQNTTVSLTYMTPAGPVAGPSEVLAPHTRKTYNVADTVPWEWEVSTKVTASRPVVAERAMYGDSR